MRRFVSFKAVSLPPPHFGPSYFLIVVRFASEKDFFLAGLGLFRKPGRRGLLSSILPNGGRIPHAHVKYMMNKVTTSIIFPSPEISNSYLLYFREPTAFG